MHNDVTHFKNTLFRIIGERNFLVVYLKVFKLPKKLKYKNEQPLDIQLCIVHWRRHHSLLNYSYSAMTRSAWEGSIQSIKWHSQVISFFCQAKLTNCNDVLDCQISFPYIKPDNFSFLCEWADQPSLKNFRIHWNLHPKQFNILVMLALSWELKARCFLADRAAIAKH